MKKQRRKRKQENGIFAPSLPKKPTASRVRAYYAKADKLKLQMVEHLWNYSLSNCGKEGCELYDVPPAGEPACFSEWLEAEIDREHEIEQAVTLFLQLEMIRRVNKQLLKTPQAKAFELQRQAETSSEDHNPFKILEDEFGPVDIPQHETLEEVLDAYFASEQGHLFAHSLNVDGLQEELSNNYSQLSPTKLPFEHYKWSKGIRYTPPIF